jgi:hypothetical protein
MSLRRTILAKSVAPSALGGGLGALSEPLIPKPDGADGEQEESEEAPIPLSSISVIIGAVLLGAAG